MSQHMEPMPHAGITRLKTYVPGKPVEDLKRELGLASIIKLASNENPLGTSPAAEDALAHFDGALYRYPDGAGYEIKSALAERHGVATDQLTLGNGSDDVLELTARVFLGPGRNAVVSQHAFAVYPIVSQAVGATVREVPALGPAADMPYGHDLEAMLGAVNEETAVIFMASPNNPTGTWIDNATLAGFLDRVPSNVVVVLDQAYIEYQSVAEHPPVTEWLARYSNLIVTRTFSKIYGMAALRFGYGLSSPRIADFLNRVRAPFNVNTLAMHCAKAALADTAFIERSVASNTAERASLARELGARGFACLPSQANFVTFDTGRDAQEVFDALLREGMIVRPLASYDLAQHLRVTVGSSAESQAFLSALDTVMSP